jgi:hypothetical protein
MAFHSAVFRCARKMPNIENLDNKRFPKLTGINFKWHRHFFMTVGGGGKPTKRRWEGNNGTFKN